jgi:DNA polymerase III sliding clamp (beta) subunit (PCNA family)
MSENKVSFSILTKDLAGQLGICNQVSAKKSEVELFTLTRVEVSADGLQLASTNGNLFYISKLKLQNSDLLPSKYIFLVKTEAFSNIISIMNDDMIEIEADLEKLTLKIKGEKAKHQLRITKDNVSDYKLPQINQEQVEVRMRVKSESLIEANKACFISVGGKNMYQPEFWNICYTIRPKQSILNIVSTDRHRITKNTLEANFLYISDKLNETEYTNYLIPPKTLQLLSASISSQESIELVLEENMVFIMIDNNLLVSRYGSGKYAEYDKIIPINFACTFEAKTTEFLSALKQIFWVVRSDLNKTINMQYNPTENYLLLSSKNSDGEKAECNVNLENYQGLSEEWSQGFNGEYLSEYINLIKTEKLLWEVNPSKPAIISPFQEKEKQFYLVTGLK